MGAPASAGTSASSGADEGIGKGQPTHSTPGVTAGFPLGFLGEAHPVASRGHDRACLPEKRFVMKHASDSFGGTRSVVSLSFPFTRRWVGKYDAPCLARRFWRY